MVVAILDYINMLKLAKKSFKDTGKQKELKALMYGFFLY